MSTRQTIKILSALIATVLVLSLMDTGNAAQGQKKNKDNPDHEINNSTDSVKSLNRI